MIQTPTTYAQWAELFKLLRNKTNDEQVLEAMYRGKLEWQSGVAERFSRQLIVTVNFRMNAATDRFQREMSYAGGREAMIVQALLSVRKEMVFLAKMMSLPVIPEKDRPQYCKLVKEQADTIQKSLEDSAKADRSGKLASIVRNHKVNSIDKIEDML